MILFVIAVIAFIVAVISLVIYIVQMHKTREQYLGKAAVESIAKQAAENARRKEHIITCDYCGGKIDTSTEKVCPQCGAAYGTDPEWIHRNRVDKGLMNAHLEKGLNKNRKEVNKLNASRMKRVKILVIIIASVLVLVTSVVIIAVTETRPFRINESQPAPDNYVKAEYTVKDPLIYEDENVSLSFGDIYYKQDDYMYGIRNNYSLEIKIRNKTDREGRAQLDIASINGNCMYSSLYEHVGADVEISRYLNIPYYYFNEDAIKEITLYNMSFMDSNYDTLMEQKEVITYETDADYQVAPKTPEGEILSERNGIVISTYYNDSDRLCLQVTNTGTEDFIVSVHAAIVNDEGYNLWMRYCIPKGARAEDPLLDRIYLEDEEDTVRSMKIQFECECLSEKEQGYVTDYLDIPIRKDAEAEP